MNVIVAGRVKKTRRLDVCLLRVGGTPTVTGTGETVKETFVLYFYPVLFEGR